MEPLAYVWLDGATAIGISASPEVKRDDGSTFRKGARVLLPPSICALPFKERDELVRMVLDGATEAVQKELAREVAGTTADAYRKARG